MGSKLTDYERVRRHVVKHGPVRACVAISHHALSRGSLWFMRRGATGTIAESNADGLLCFITDEGVRNNIYLMQRFHIPDLHIYRV